MSARICVLTGCLDNYLPLAETTIFKNKARYCRRHGYDLYLCRATQPPYDNQKSHAAGFSWTRLAQMLLLVQLGCYDWVYCVGCDTMITNLSLRLEDIIARAGLPLKECPAVRSKLPPGVPARVLHHWPAPKYQPDGRTHVIFACDRASVVQADSFLIRGTPQGAAYLEDILDQYQVFKTAPWVEQQAMMDLREKHTAIMRIVPQWVCNSYDYGLYAHLGPYYDGLDCYGERGQWSPGDFLVHWPSTSLAMRLRLAKKYDSEVIG